MQETRHLCRGLGVSLGVSLKKLHAQGFDIVGVCYDKPADIAKVKAYLAAHGMAWPQTFDADIALGVEYGPQGIPFTILIGRDGKVAATDLRGAALAPAIAAALQRNFP
ncbi:MAG: TlpA family protein disulfide reductase [Armatimonadota bacterium]|nr:TlpA family protein disulfide reductase [Armatimonadota bacterium]